MSTQKKRYISSQNVLKSSIKTAREKDAKIKILHIYLIFALVINKCVFENTT